MGLILGLTPTFGLRNCRPQTLESHCYQTTFAWGRLGDLNPGPTHYESSSLAERA